MFLLRVTVFTLSGPVFTQKKSVCTQDGSVLLRAVLFYIKQICWADLLLTRMYLFYFNRAWILFNSGRICFKPVWSFILRTLLCLLQTDLLSLRTINLSLLRTGLFFTWKWYSPNKSGYTQDGSVLLRKYLFWLKTCLFFYNKRTSFYPKRTCSYTEWIRICLC